MQSCSYVWKDRVPVNPPHCTTHTHELITSSNSKFIATNKPSLLSSQFPLRLYTDPFETVPSLPSNVCTESLFNVVPGLHLLSNKSSSCIESFYSVAGRWEPYEWTLTVDSAYLLVRKIAALYHALVFSHQTVTWLDIDVIVVKPPDHRFHKFVSAADVTYTPFVFDRSRHNDVRPFQVEDDYWRIESGIISCRQTMTRTLRLMLKHYDGGAAKLAHECSLRQNWLCDVQWVRQNLFLDDVFVWSMFMHGKKFDHTFKQQWFAATDSLRCKDIPIGSCANSSLPNTSPFRLGEYFKHHLQGPYSKHPLRSPSGGL
jgi:hypothetical protein